MSAFDAAGKQEWLNPVALRSADRLALAAVAESVIALVERFLEAFNARDEQRMSATLHVEIEFRFRQSVLKGKAGLRSLLRQQAHGVGYHIEHGRCFERDGRLATEIRKQLRWVETGDLAEVEDVAGAFVAKDGLLVRYSEFDDLAAAIAASGVTETDEVNAG